MPSAAALRLQIETALADRIPGALTPRPRILRDLAATGIPELDSLLNGGLPIGAITELVGPASSGRTTLALATLAELTQSSKTVAWVDVADTLDPESAAAAGVDLARQLWVRCGKPPAPLTSTSHPQPAQQTANPAFLVEGSRTPAPSGGCGSPHPRSESRGMSEAIDALLQQPDTFSRATMVPRHHYNQSRKERGVGTPSAPNRKLLPPKALDRTPHDPRPIYRRAKDPAPNPSSKPTPEPFPHRATDREEQIPTDRQPTRRQILHACSEPTHQNREARQGRQTLQQAQIANTAAVSRNRPGQPQPGGHWTDNTNNAHGRALHTPPNAIAAGLPRFRDMEARAAGQGHGLNHGPFHWKPSPDQLNRLRTTPAIPQASAHPTTPSVAATTQSATASTASAGAALSTTPTTLSSRPEAAGRSGEICRLAEPQTLTRVPQVSLLRPGFAGPHQKRPANKQHTPSLAGDRPANLSKAASPLWQALDQALRATDLLLAAGGFSAIVLDLGSTPPEFAWRIPLATWFRFRAAADRARTVLLVLTQHPCARSSAELVLRLNPAEPEAATTVLTGAHFRVALDRRRFETHPDPKPIPQTAQPTTPGKLHLVPTRKPPQREINWRRRTAHTGAQSPSTLSSRPEEPPANLSSRPDAPPTTLSSRPDAPPTTLSSRPERTAQPVAERRDLLSPPSIPPTSTQPTRDTGTHPRGPQ